MKGPFRIVAWANLLPAAVVCLLAPASLFRFVGLPFEGETAAFLLRYLGVAYAVLFVANAIAASRPSVWKPILALDLVLFGGSALVPLSFHLQSATVSWFWWANLGLDTAMFLLVAAAAIRTFWMK